MIVIVRTTVVTFTLPGYETNHTMPHIDPTPHYITLRHSIVERRGYPGVLLQAIRSEPH